MHHNNEDKHDDGYKFIEETIKPSSNKKNIFNYILKMCVSGIAFGMCACLAFYIFRPWMSEVFREHNIVIEQDDIVNEEDIQAESNDDTEKFIETFNDIHDVASNAASSIISIKPYSYDETQAELSFDSVAGIIIAENDTEYFALAIDTVCDDAEFWRASVRYGKECSAGMLRRDKNTGFAIFSIIKDGLEPEIVETIQIASLGNSNMLAPGNITMAVGDIFGKQGGTDYGIIEASDIREIVPDIHYNLVDVDMFPVASRGGYLFDIDGKLIGVFRPEYNDAYSTKAVGISDLKPIIELLVNGQEVPYAGIYTETISETISEENDIPAGVYVLQVERDSPAMECGISNGDIITYINNIEIKSEKDYEQALLSTKPGDTVEVKAKRKGAAGYVDITLQLTIKTKE